MHLILLGDDMTGKRRPTFNPEFKLESAQLVVDQNYSVRQAAEAVNVSASAMEDIYGHPLEFSHSLAHQLIVSYN